MMFLRQRSRGTTLIETIVVIAVFSLLALTITWLLIGGLRAWHRGQTRVALRSDARYALDQIQADFRQAHNVTTPPTSALVTDKYTQLKFARYTYNTAAGNIPPGTDVSVTYTINHSTFTLTRQDTATTVIAENVVDTDPRGTGNASYFAWEDAGHTTMGVHLYLVENASYHATGPDPGLTASTSLNAESILLNGGAFWAASSQVSGGTPPSSAQDQAQALINTPSSLTDTRLHGHR